MWGSLIQGEKKKRGPRKAIPKMLPIGAYRSSRGRTVSSLHEIFPDPPGQLFGSARKCWNIPQHPGTMN